MQCKDTEGRLNQLLDDRLQVNADQELSAHLVSCGECARLAKAYWTLADEASYFAVPAYRNIPKEHIARQVGMAGRSRISWRLRTFGALAAAAAVLAMVVPMWLNRPAKENDRAVAKIDEDRSELPVTDPNQKRVDQFAQVALANYDRLADETRSRVGEAFRILPALGGKRAPREQVSSLAPRLAKAIITAEWVDDVAAGFEPVRRTTSNAIGFIWNSVPVSERLRARY